MKKFCAVYGLFRNEYRFLPLWIKYYSELFGMENLYVLDHCSTDGSTKDLKCNVEIVGENVKFCNHDWIYEIMLKKHIELLKEYNYVVSVDADEFIFTKHGNLRDYIENNKSNEITRCTGYEVMHMLNEDHLDWNKPILIKQRNWWIRLNTYDKESIVTKETNWSRGRHYTKGKEREKPDKNLILCHLHRVDYTNCKRKYLLHDLSGIENKIFPIFTDEESFKSYFYEPNYHIHFGAEKTKLERIPKEFENIL